MGTNDDLAVPELQIEATKTPASGGSRERMMGLEPTTFCLARTLRGATGGDGRRREATGAATPHGYAMQRGPVPTRTVSRRQPLPTRC